MLASRGGLSSIIVVQPLTGAVNCWFTSTLSGQFAGSDPKLDTQSSATYVTQSGIVRRVIKIHHSITGTPALPRDLIEGFECTPGFATGMPAIVPEGEDYSLRAAAFSFSICCKWPVPCPAILCTRSATVTSRCVSGWNADLERSAAFRFRSNRKL